MSAAAKAKIRRRYQNSRTKCVTTRAGQRKQHKACGEPQREQHRSWGLQSTHTHSSHITKWKMKCRQQLGLFITTFFTNKQTGPLINTKSVSVNVNVNVCAQCVFIQISAGARSLITLTVKRRRRKKMKCRNVFKTGSKLH